MQILFPVSEVVVPYRPISCGDNHLIYSGKPLGLAGPIGEEGPLVPVEPMLHEFLVHPLAEAVANNLFALQNACDQCTSTQQPYPSLDTGRSSAQTLLEAIFELLDESTDPGQFTQVDAGGTLIPWYGNIYIHIKAV